MIDDDAAIRAMYGGLLGAEGYKVYEAETAEVAADFLTRKTVELVLLDINMPAVDGAAMKKILDTCGQGFKVMVASVYPIERQRKMISGVDDYYDKAQSPDLLLEKIHQLIGGTAANRF